MSNQVHISDSLMDLPYIAPERARISPHPQSDMALPASITRAGSAQTYYTIRLLADRDRVMDAYRAYAYFRWVDDCIDEHLAEQAEQIAFVRRQQALVDAGYSGRWPYDATSEEQMLGDLIRGDRESNSGLRAYIGNMMRVMAFDVERRGRLISQAELADYSRYLSTAVTEALHYFIGHDDPTPPAAVRYLAVTGAHIAHMLRDTFEDTAAGYFNIPVEFLDAYGINRWDINSDAYRAWVSSRIQEARFCFQAGKETLAQVANLRCRIAGYAYIARFEWVLDTIERESCHLRPAYPERKSLRAAMQMGWSLGSALLSSHPRGQK